MTRFARGLREKGQGRDGFFTVNASKTVAVPVEELYAAVTDAVRRDEWLPGVYLNERTATPRGASRRLLGFLVGAGAAIVALASRHDDVLV